VLAALVLLLMASAPDRAVADPDPRECLHGDALTGENLQKFHDLR
jgi:hypothetical protein